jgi:NADH-quinone oxidoreductase subunit K
VIGAPAQALLVAAALFVLGLLAVLVRRNLVFTLLGIEVMLNASGLAFVAAGARWGDAAGQGMLLFVLAVAAAEVAVGLALVLQVARRFGTLDPDRLLDLAERSQGEVAGEDVASGSIPAAQGGRGA